MGERRKSANEWSSRKAWFMGIASALLIALITAIGSILYTEWKGPPPSERERTAVYKLIDDIRRHYLYFHAVYQGRHEFITSRWLRCRDTDSFYESAETRATIFTLGYAMGRFGDGFRLLDEKCGTVTGVVTRFDKFKETVDGIVARGSIKAAPERQPATVDLDTHNLLVYTIQPTAFPPAVLSNASELDVPVSIRERVAAMRTLGEPLSFQRTLQTSTDFVLLSSDSMAGNDSPESNTTLYFHGTRLSLFEYVGLCLRLAQSIQEWADRSSIDLGDDAFGAYEKIYRARQQ